MQQENNEEFDILIIADNPSLNVLPTVVNKPWALQKLSGFTFLDFCLEWISWFESPNVIVATSTIKQDTCDAIQRRWALEFKNPNSLKAISTLKILNFKNCITVNDLMREVESRRLLERDFILIDNIATFCSSNLATQLPLFKSRLRLNKNNVLTLLYTVNGSRDCPYLGISNEKKINSVPNKLMLYQSQNDNRIKIAKNLFTPDVCIRSDISPCGIALCAYELRSHFCGNYDFQNFDKIIHDILSNEDFLGQNITIELISDVAAFSANDYQSLLRAQALILKRKCFPLTFDNILPHFKDFERPQFHSNKNICISAGKDCPIGNVEYAIFGKSFMVHETATVKLTSFGTNSKISKNTIVLNSICGDFVHFGENSYIDSCIIENNVTIEPNCQLKKHCYIGSNIVIPAGTILEDGTVLLNAPPPEKLQRYLDEAESTKWIIESDKVNGYYSWYIKKPGKNRRISFWYLNNTLSSNHHRQRSDSVTSCSSNISYCSKTSGSENNEGSTNDLSNLELNQTTGAYQANNVRFFEEVLETMSALAISDKIQIDAAHIEKMKLEINTSRFTNNVHCDDSPKHIFLAFLSIPGVYDSFKKLCLLFENWDILWKNYYKRDVSKLQMLHAIEEFAILDEKFKVMVPNLIHFLFDTIDFLPEDIIIKWYDGLPVTNPLESFKKLKEVIDWIQQSDDEEDSEE